MSEKGPEFNPEMLDAARKANMEAIKKTGIVDAFSELRDSGEVRGTEDEYADVEVKRSLMDRIKGRYPTEHVKVADATPAKIMWNGDRSVVALRFNEGWGWIPSGGAMDGTDVWCFKQVKASIKDGGLIINEKPVEGDLLEFVRNETKTAKTETDEFDYLLPDNAKFSVIKEVDK